MIAEECVVFGRALRRIRKAKGISQERLSLLTGIDRAHLSRIETGKTVLPEDHVRQRIAAALGMTEDDLLIDAGIDPAKLRDDGRSPVIISPPTRRVEEYAPDDPVMATMELMPQLERRDQNAVFVLAKHLFNTKEQIVGHEVERPAGGEERNRRPVYRVEEIGDRPIGITGHGRGGAIGTL